MFAAELLCSDEACAWVTEASGTLEHLEHQTCAGCDCTLVVLSVWEVSDLRPAALTAPTDLAAYRAERRLRDAA